MNRDELLLHDHVRVRKTVSRIFIEVRVDDDESSDQTARWALAAALPPAALLARWRGHACWCWGTTGISACATRVARSTLPPWCVPGVMARTSAGSAMPERMVRVDLAVQRRGDSA